MELNKSFKLTICDSGWHCHNSKIILFVKISCASKVKTTPRCKSPNSTMNGLRKVWRESASLLLLSKSPAKSPATCNYDVLVMKRSTASKFMANAIVFPGGVIEKSDSAGNWLDLYRDLGVDDKHLAALKNSRNKDFIYCRGEEEIDRELSLRIVDILSFYLHSLL